jgi:hypothetical protein
MMKTLYIAILLLLAGSLAGQSTGGKEATKTLQVQYNAQNATAFAATYYNAANVNTLAKQQKVWQQIVGIEKYNATYWFNYYMISRLYMLQTNKGKLDSKAKQQLETIAVQMDSAIKTDYTLSFEKSAVKYFNETDAEKATTYLLMAEKLNPTHPLLLPELARHYEFEQNTTKRNTLLASMPEINQRTGLYQLSAAMATKLPDSAVVITNGDYDTYALWLALGNNTKNITVISLKLIENLEYRAKIFKQAGLQLPVEKELNTPDFLHHILLANKNSAKKIYVSFTVNSVAIKSAQTLLYNVGMCYQYSAQSIDNIALLYENLVEKVPIVQFPTKDIEVLKNLMPGYITLYRHYKTTDVAKAQQVLDAAKIFAQKGSFWNNYHKYFN